MAKTVYEIRVVAHSDGESQAPDLLRVLRTALPSAAWEQPGPAASPSNRLAALRTPRARAVLLAALGLLACWDISTDRDRLARAEQAAAAKNATGGHALKAREAKLLEAEGAATEAREALQAKQTEAERQEDTLAAPWQSAIKRLGDSLQARGRAVDGGAAGARMANPNDTDAPDVFASAWKLEAIQQQFRNERRSGAERLAVIAGQDGGEAAAWPPPLEGEALRRELRKKPDHFYDPAFEISHSNPAKDR